MPLRPPRFFNTRRAIPSAALPFLTTILLLIATAEAHASPAPKRIVSMNLCTDQMAMLLAKPGQLHSVSHLARDPQGSVMVEEAHAFAVNHGLAEEIFVMKPDLVLAGTFTSRASVAMLRRLGFRVEEFAPAYSFDDIRSHILRMGHLFHQDARAQELVEDFDRRIAETPDPTSNRWRPLAALHFANSYTSGSGTLASEVVERAGLENLGSRLGLTGTMRLPLENLIMAEPELVVGGTRRDSASPALAFQTFEHPALRAVLHARDITTVPDKYWICGAPFTAEAVGILAAAAAPIAARRAATP